MATAQGVVRMVAQEERVPIQDVMDLIRVGEPLPFKVLDAQARLLLNEGQHIASERQYGLLVERGAWVDRKLVEQHRQQQAADGGTAAPAKTARPFTLFDRWERLLWDLDAVLRPTARGRGTPAEWQAMVDELVAMVDRDSDIALFAAVRQDDRRFALYPLAHALHTAVIALLTARHAGWATARQRSLVGAALSMNVAMMDLQALMAEQAEPPKPKQLETIRAHPRLAVQCLQACGITDALWLQSVADHHEQPDGKGYPRGTRHTTDDATLLRMADVYMAKITARAFRAPLAPLQASGQLFQQAQGSPLALALIKAIGVHPPGSLVRLKSGEVAVVKHRATAGRSTRACTLSDPQGKPHPDSRERDTAEAAYAITGPCDDTTHYPRVLGERVYGDVRG